MVVYLDLLIAINLIFNFVLLTIAGWMGLHRFSWRRYALAAGLGTVFALIFFFRPQYIFVSWFCRLAGGLAMAYVAWPQANLRKIFSRTMILLVAGQLMGGGIYSLAYALDGTPLGDQTAFSLGVVAGGGLLVLAVAAWWVARIHRAKQQAVYVGQVTIHFQGRAAKLSALLDSGNTLRHPVTSWPVVIVERKAAQGIFPHHVLAWLEQPLTAPPPGLETRIALVPYQSVGGAGVLAAIRPDNLVLSCPAGNQIMRHVYIAVRPKEQRPLEYQALAFPLENLKEGGIA